MANSEQNTGQHKATAKYNIVFHNAEDEEIGTLNFDGPGLTFDGIADLSAITFINWVSEAFKQRLTEEYERGFNDGKAAK